MNNNDNTTVALDATALVEEVLNAMKWFLHNEDTAKCLPSPHDHVKACRLLIRHDMRLFARHANRVAKMGDLATLQWLASHNVHCSKIGVHFAASNAHWEVVHWLSEQDITNYASCAVSAATQANINELEWAFSEDPGCLSSSTANFAAENGHFNILKWLVSKGVKCGLYVANDAAASGHLEMVQWLFANEIKCNQVGANLAASNGHDEVLRWLGERGIYCTQYGVNMMLGCGTTNIQNILRDQGLHPKSLPPHNILFKW